jgi:hypothetical protein
MKSAYSFAFCMVAFIGYRYLLIPENPVNTLMAEVKAIFLSLAKTAFKKDEYAGWN